MTPKQKEILENQGFIICPNCMGSGEFTAFCGHDIEVACNWCDGDGIVNSLNKQRHTATCNICSGRGGPGCCDNRGYQEWETFELLKWATHVTNFPQESPRLYLWDESKRRPCIVHYNTTWPCHPTARIPRFHRGNGGSNPPRATIAKIRKHLPHKRYWLKPKNKI